MKDHVEHTDGGAMCRHCGGVVDGDGYAMHLGEDNTEGFESEERQGNEPMETEQNQSTEEMRGNGFADAIKRRSAAKYAEGGMVSMADFEASRRRDPDNPSENSPDMLRDAAKSDAQKSWDDEMKKKKAEKYGFGRK